MADKGDGLLRREGYYNVDVLGRSIHVFWYGSRQFGKMYDDWVFEVRGYPDYFSMSVIRKPGSYGYEGDLYEIAFLENGELTATFQDEWRGDVVLGYLDEADVLSWLEKAVRKIYG